jgi:hypothetical protein
MALLSVIVDALRPDMPTSAAERKAFVQGEIKKLEAEREKKLAELEATRLKVERVASTGRALVEKRAEEKERELSAELAGALYRELPALLAAVVGDAPSQSAREICNLIASLEARAKDELACGIDPQNVLVAASLAIVAERGESAIGPLSGDVHGAVNLAAAILRSARVGATLDVRRAAEQLLQRLDQAARGASGEPSARTLENWPVRSAWFRKVDIARETEIIRGRYRDVAMAELKEKFEAENEFVNGIVRRKRQPDGAAL